MHASIPLSLLVFLANGHFFVASFSPGAGATSFQQPTNSTSGPDVKICIFGDYTPMSSDFITPERKNCSVVLVVGRQDNLEKTSAGGKSLISYSPKQVSTGQGKNVTTIFGETGVAKPETAFFSSSETDGVAFLQCAATLYSMVKLEAYGSEQYTKVTEYFRETMLNELECKLQELHSRQVKPWIIVFLTHPGIMASAFGGPYSINYGLGSTETELTLNDSVFFSARFFEIIQRYKVDLVTSCGNYGMPKIFTDYKANHPTEEVPKFLATNTGNGIVLDITGTNMRYTIPKWAGVPESGTIAKNQQPPGKCVEKELEAL